MNGPLTITNGNLTTGAITSTGLTVNSGGGTAFTVNNGDAIVNGNILSVTQNVAGELVAGRLVTNLSDNISRKIVTFNNVGNEFQFNGIGTRATNQTYHVSSLASNHIFYAANSPLSDIELFRIGGNGNAVLAGALQAVPQYGMRYKTNNQTVGIGSSQSVSWVDYINAGPLTSNGVSWTNNTGRNLYIMVSYSITWDPIVLGGNVSTFVSSTAGLAVYLQDQQGFPAGAIGQTCSSSGVIDLPNGSSIELVAMNSNAQNLDIKSAAAQMSYYLLN